MIGIARAQIERLAGHEVRPLRDQVADLLLGTGRVADIDRQAGGHGVDHVRRPAADHIVRGLAVDIEAAAVADGQIVEHGQRVVERLVVTGEAALDLGVVVIDARVVAVVVLQMARRIVDGLGPGEGVQEVEAVRVSLFQFDLESFIAAEAAVVGDFDVGEALNGAARNQAEILTRLDWAEPGWRRRGR